VIPRHRCTTDERSCDESARGRSRQGARIPGGSIRPVELNGAPGALLLDGREQVIGVWTLEVGEHGIAAITSVVNPDKLSHLGPVADLGELLRHRD
jgi:hypothetical protein